MPQLVVKNSALLGSAQGAAAMSLILRLLSIALNLYPVGLVFPLYSWLGEFLPLFLPFLVWASASGLAVLGLVRSPRWTWLAIVGLILGIIGMAMGSLLTVVTVHTPDRRTETRHSVMHVRQQCGREQACDVTLSFL
jgi:hypothetical protein